MSCVLLNHRQSLKGNPEQGSIKGYPRITGKDEAAGAADAAREIIRDL
jgi:hypothetical protein